MNCVKVTGIIVCLVLLTGCAWWGAKDELVTPEALYNKGYSDYQDGDYKDAIESFQRLKEEYPLSKYALTAELGIADSYFSDEDWISAEVAYRDFIDFHPTNENLPYVMYQIGMCHYNQMLGVDRDQTETRLAKEAFERLIARYPENKFSFTAEKRLSDCLERLAEHEFYVGHFYFKTGKYEAALRRFEGIQRDYNDPAIAYKVSYYIHETKRRLLEESAGEK